MRQEHLAMMSVPKQKWKPITGPAQALRQGTVFEDLNLPFFVTADQSEGQNSPLDDQLRDSIMANLEKSGQQKQREGLMRKMQEISFTVDDLRLYMDTHPQDQEGLRALKGALKKRQELLRDFALAFYPLTMDCMTSIMEQNPESTCYGWSKGPMPWEGACV